MSTDVDLSQLAIDRAPPQRPPAPARRHLLTRYVIPGALLAGFVALATWAAWQRLFPPRDVTVVPVLATRAAVEREGTPLFKAAGWVEPRPTPIRVAALAPGVVEDLRVVEDQAVAKGEPVAELVKDDARLAYQRRQAELALSAAELDDARAQLRSAVTRLEAPVHLEAVLREAEAARAAVETELKNLPFALARARADLEFAEKDYEGKLASQGAVAGRAIDGAKSTVDAARALVEELEKRQTSLAAQCTAAAARCTALTTQLDLKAEEIRAKEQSEAKVRAAAARVEQARVAAAEAKLFLDRMTVRAPVDGRVLHLVAPPGSRLMGGDGAGGRSDGTTVVTMYRPDMLQARVDVRFDDLPRVELAQPVSIENPALEEPLRGSVLLISSLADIQKNTLQVKVAIESPPPVFKPDMLVDVTFLAPPTSRHDAPPSEEMRLLVPGQLVQQGDGGRYVWLADQSAGVARRVAIEVGAAASNGLVEVRGGLKPGSRLIASGTQGLRDGDRIRVAGEEPQIGSPSTAGSPGSARRAIQRLPSGDGH